MSELEPLEPVAQELLDAARGGHAPPLGGRDRVRRNIILRVGVSAFTGTALASAWVKVVVPFAVLAIGTSAYFVANRAPAAPAPLVVVVAPPVDMPAIDPVVPAAPVVATPVETAIEPAATIAPKPTVVSAVKVAALPTVVPVPAPASIEEETMLLLSAQTALPRDPARALVLLDDHAARFPNGTLSEERDATRVLALCAVGRKAEAKTLGQEFLAKHPRSPAAARVRTSCASP